MPFRFKMQKVLDYRAQLEEEAKVRLAEAEHRLREAQDRLDAILAEVAAAEEKSRAGGLLQSGERWLHEQYLKGLHSDASAAELQCRMQRQMTEEARTLLAERAMERKLLEKLKERQKAQYQHAERLQEQHFNDEISTLRYKASAF
ncbi:MAG: flagellar export protein FliJ [Desulfovibrio sp.]|nr:flagellar export protein FliJ [Desulfovibrio sp.]